METAPCTRNPGPPGPKNGGDKRPPEISILKLNPETAGSWTTGGGGGGATTTGTTTSAAMAPPIPTPKTRPEDRAVRVSNQALSFIEPLPNTSTPQYR